MIYVESAVLRVYSQFVCQDSGAINKNIVYKRHLSEFGKQQQQQQQQPPLVEIVFEVTLMKV